MGCIACEGKPDLACLAVLCEIVSGVYRLNEICCVALVAVVTLQRETVDPHTAAVRRRLPLPGR